MLPFPRLFGGSSAAPATVAFQAYSSTSTGTNTLTFSSVAIGTAASDRYIAVIIHERNSSSGSFTPNTVTVAGQSCTRQVQASNGVSGYSAEMWTTDAPVTTGTTANIVADWGAGLSNGAVISVFSMTGLTSSTATQTKTSQGNFSVPTAMSVDVSAGGIIIAAGTTSDTTPGTSVATGVTETYDTGASFGASTGGCVASATAQTISVNFTWTPAASGASRTMHVAAAFR